MRLKTKLVLAITALVNAGGHLLLRRRSRPEGS